MLREHNQLPNGIDTLRLPKRLQRYIDLTEELDGTQLLPPEKPVQRPTNAMQRLETISSGTESEDESDNHVQLLEAVTDAEKAAVAAFVATAGEGVNMGEAKQAAIEAYAAAQDVNPPSDQTHPPLS